MEIKKVCFIGHRSFNTIPVREKLKNCIQELINDGYNFFMIGCHGDFDKLSLSVCRELKKLYNIDIEIVLTSLHIFDKENIYDDKSTIYRDVSTILYECENVFYKNRIEFCNKKMVDECDVLVCYIDETKYKSGAKLIYNYAKKQRKTIINLFDNCYL